jgi:hypothetical protein
MNSNSHTARIPKCEFHRAAMERGLQSSGVNEHGILEVWIVFMPRPTVISTAQHLSRILSFLKFLRRDFGIVPVLKVVMEDGFGIGGDQGPVGGFNSWRAPTTDVRLVHSHMQGRTVFQFHKNTTRSIRCSVRQSQRPICSI